MDRRDFYKGQYVAQGELDDAFAGAERADRDLVVDEDLIGVASGGVVTQHSPTPDLTVDVAAMLGYDQQGRRLKIPSPQTVNLAVDSSSVATAVINPGNTKIVSLFVRFKRALSDPRTDLDGLPVNFVQLESFEFVVVQGAEAGSPTPPALLSDGILIADITRSYGQTQILNGVITTTRKAWQFALTAGALSIVAGTPKAAVLAVLTELNNHVQGVSNKHPATAITYAGGGTTLADGLSTTGGAWATVEGALDQIIGVFVTGLFDQRINVSGVAAVGGTDPAIPAGTLLSVLTALKRATNLYAPASGELVADDVAAQLAALDARVTGRIDDSTCNDANKTIQPQDVDSFKVANTLTANRTLSLDPPTKNGRLVTFVRVNPDSSWSYTIKRNGGADLAVLGPVEFASVTLRARAGVWVLESCGGLGVTVNKASGP